MDNSITLSCLFYASVMIWSYLSIVLVKEFSNRWYSLGSDDDSQNCLTESA